MEQSTQNSRVVQASQEDVYHAFTDPGALEAWQAPGDMTAKVHNFDLRVGGGYQMSLFYPDGEDEMQGKTSRKEDKFTARFVELVPPQKIVEAVNFETTNPDFLGEMIMEATLQQIAAGTEVTISFKNIPKGIKPSDNEAGTISSLKKLAEWVEGRR